MGVSYVKFCPQCQTTNNVETQACVKCGHKFRSQFQVPVSEKTVALSDVDLPPMGHEPGDMPRTPTITPRRRPRPLRRLALVILGITLIGTAVRFGGHAAMTKTAAPPPSPAPAASASFQPYEVVFKGDTQGYPAPLATQSPNDLQRYQPSGADENSVRLYNAGRIMLVYPGTTARVLQEGKDWQRVVLLDGSHRGENGYVHPQFVQRPGTAALPSTNLLPTTGITQ